MAERCLEDFSFNSCATRLQEVRARVREALAAQGCEEELANKLVLVVDEACTNVIRHGYKGEDCHQIHLVILEDGGVLTFRIRDHAEPVDGSCIQPRDLRECRPGGLGINFIDSVMDSWEFRRPDEGTGNLLVMRKRIERGSQ